MRRVLPVVMALLLTTAAFAATTAPASPTPEINWAVVIVSILAASSIGTRIIGWAWTNRKLLRFLFDVLERMVESADPSTSAGAKDIKATVDEKTAKAGGEVRALADKLAAAAEKKLDKNGTATDTRKRNRWGRLHDNLKRWVPIVGAFL